MVFRTLFQVSRELRLLRIAELFIRSSTKKLCACRYRVRLVGVSMSMVGLL